MIPWVKEKFAERRTRWLASRKRDGNSTSNNSSANQRNLEKQNYDSIQTNGISNWDQAGPSTPSSGISSLDDSSRQFYRPLNLRIISPRGEIMNISVDPMILGEKLKLEVLRKFTEDSNTLIHFSLDVENMLPKYKLIRSKTKQIVDDKLSLLDADIKQNDEFILIVKRTYPVPAAHVNISGPTPIDVLNATQHLPSTQPTPPSVNIDQMVLPTDLRYDIRKILISLAQSSAYVIGAGPYAERLITILKQRLINRKHNEADTVQSLIEMGFSKSKVNHALRLKNDVYSEALDWLIENSGVPETQINELSSHGSNDTSTSILQPSLSSKSNNIASKTENIQALLEIIRIYSYRDSPPPAESVMKIVEMGFSESDAIEALKITKNNEAAACEWLIGSRSKSLTELRDGFSSDSPVLQALLSSPQVQISLGNPKMFIAYLSMMDNYSSMSMWLSDTDTSGVLGHILRTYHEEKHIVAINQFSTLL